MAEEYSFWHMSDMDKRRLVQEWGRLQGSAGWARASYTTASNAWLYRGVCLPDTFQVVAPDPGVPPGKLRVTVWDDGRGRLAGCIQVSRTAAPECLPLLMTHEMAHVLLRGLQAGVSHDAVEALCDLLALLLMKEDQLQWSLTHTRWPAAGVGPMMSSLRCNLSRAGGEAEVARAAQQMCAAAGRRGREVERSVLEGCIRELSHPRWHEFERDVTVASHWQGGPRLDYAAR